MVDRTANTTFDLQTEPKVITGLTSVSNGDYITVPNGTIARCQATGSGDNDAIITVTVLTSKVTFSILDDAGAAVDVDSNVYFDIYLEEQ